MGADTKIEWADHTFNPWVGCTKVSPACDFCYAELWARRTGQADLWAGNRRRTSTANWKAPLRWNREAAAAGTRPRVFCASLADVFDNQVPETWRSDLFALIEETPHLDWLLLTKRPQNIAKMIWPKWDAGLPSHIWLGTTVENQEEADRRIPHLLAVPAAVRFLSCEPLLGPVDLTSIDLPGGWEEVFPLGQEFLGRAHVDDDGRPMTRIHLVIAGGESGPKARSMHPDWARGLRDQCQAAGVAFFFKQWGEYLPAIDYDDGVRSYLAADDGGDDDRLAGFPQRPVQDLDGQSMWRVGKKAAGRLLDGRTWDEMPWAGR